MTMWTERTGLTRWTTAAISSSKTRSWSGLPTADRQKRQQRLRRRSPRSTAIEYGASIVDGLFVKEQTLRLTGQSTGPATSQVSQVLEGRHFRAVLVRKRSNVGGRTSATGHLLLQNHTCLRTSIIVGTNRRAGRWDAIFGVGTFRILDLGRRRR